MSQANINNLNGISTSLDPFGFMQTYSTPTQKRRNKMAKEIGKETANGNKNIPKKPKMPAGGAKKMGKSKGKGKQPC